MGERNSIQGARKYKLDQHFYECLFEISLFKTYLCVTIKRCYNYGKINIYIHSLRRKEEIDLHLNTKVLKVSKNNKKQSNNITQT